MVSEQLVPLQSSVGVEEEDGREGGREGGEKQVGRIGREEKGKRRCIPHCSQFH